MMHDEQLHRLRGDCTSRRRADEEQIRIRIWVLRCEIFQPMCSYGNPEMLVCKQGVLLRLKFILKRLEIRQSFHMAIDLFQ